jgi:hypothetical protein
VHARDVVGGVAEEGMRRCGVPTACGGVRGSGPKSPTQEQRETILEMARAWRMLAETRRRLLRQGYVPPREN